MQLSLFEDNWQNGANKLLDLLNDGRKGKEVYGAGNAAKVRNLVIISAHNKDSSVYNILDESGIVPSGFDMCWRSITHIQFELKDILK